MNEFEDVILPDDYESSPQETESIEETPVESFEDNLEQPTETEQQPQVEPPLTFKVKYNKEEQELTYDDAVPLIQKGMNYDKLQERLNELSSDPRLNFVEQLAQEQGMNVNEYLEAVQHAREQERINELVQKGISEDVAQELLETRKFREQIEAERRTKSEQERQNAEYNEFFTYFKNANGRDYNTETDKIPQEVWEAHNQGTPLKYAYMEHYNNQLQSQVKVLKQNQENTKKAPITGLSAHGSTEVASEDDFMRGFNSI